MNKRAFNLFTALVSFVLIMLTMLLVNSMTAKEGSTVSTINDISAQAQMQTAADLARADAMQVFNYSLRQRIETWLSSPTNWYVLTKGKNWNDIVKDYACVNFGGCPRYRCSDNANTECDCPKDTVTQIKPQSCASSDCGGGECSNQSGVQFADVTANTMSGLLEMGQTSGRYDIQLEDNQDELRKALVEINQRSVDKGEFFEVVDCELPETGASKEQIQACLGTFYVKLKMSLIDDETYEKLPKIVVKNITTGDYLKQGILPHADFRIYVPLRIFKAIAQTKYYAENSIFLNNDYFGSLKLGLCDAGCIPREYAGNSTGNGTLSGSACPNTPDMYLPNGAKDKVKTVKLKNKNGTVIGNYNSEEPDSMKMQLQLIVKQEICDTAATDDLIDVDPYDDLNLVKDPAATGCGIFNSEVTVITLPSKRILAEPYTFDTTANCATTQQINAKIRFRETNPKYKINKKNENIYTIAIVDSYSYTESAVLPVCKTLCSDGDIPGCATANLSCAPG